MIRVLRLDPPPLPCGDTIPLLMPTGAAAVVTAAIPPTLAPRSAYPVVDPVPPGW